MQSGDKAAAVSFAAASGSVAEADYVRAGLLQTCVECEFLGVIGHRNKSCTAIRIIAHENGELSA